VVTLIARINVKGKSILYGEIRICCSFVGKAANLITIVDKVNYMLFVYVQCIQSIDIAFVRLERPRHDGPSKVRMTIFQTKEYSLYVIVIGDYIILNCVTQLLIQVQLYRYEA